MMNRMLPIGKCMIIAVFIAIFFTFYSEPALARSYTVKKGDNLETIADRFGVTVDEIIALNTIKDKNVIVIGSTLEIPEDGTAAETKEASQTDVTASAEPSADSQKPSQSPAQTKPPAIKISTSSAPKTAAANNTSPASKSSGLSAAAESVSPTISMNVVEADVRDVLSALALNLGRNIVFKGTPAKITVRLEDFPANAALEYVAKLSGLIYIEEEDVIIVGDRDMISSDFTDHLEIAEFKLRYITAETLSEQILALGLRVESLSIPANPKTLWIQAFPVDLVKIRQIIRMLDKDANIELGSSEIKNYFRPISVEYISASEFKTILEQLALPSGFTLDNNPGTLYVFASNEDFAAINQIKSVVDVIENYSMEGSYFTSDKIELYNLNYMTTESVVSLFEDLKEKTEAGVDIGVIYTGGLKMSVWLCGTPDEITEAKNIIAAVDVPEMNVMSQIEVFRLFNVTAVEMEKKLNMLAIPEMTIYTFPYASFGKSILVSCPGDYMYTVSQMIDTLDQDSPSVTLPVDSSDVEAGASRLYNRRILIAELSGIPISSFKISSNIAKDNSYRFVMYLTASPEDIQRVKDIIAEIDGV